jgi:O-antigen/teichoic acid export membrane protein
MSESRTAQAETDASGAVDAPDGVGVTRQGTLQARAKAVRHRARKALRHVGIGQGASKSLRASTVRGSMVSMAEAGISQVLALGSNFLLAWLLFPAAFGVMSLVRVILLGLKQFSDIGATASIVQSEKGEDPVFLNTVFTVQALRGVGIWLVASALAWPAGKMYDVPELAYVLPVAAFSSVIAGLNSAASATLSRRMAWGPMAVVRVLSQVASIVSMALLAWWLRSVWALVAGWYASTIVQTIGSHIVAKKYAKQNPKRFMLDREAMRHLFKFGRWIFISTLLTFLAGQVDRLMLGRLITLDDLGVYSLAMVVVMMPGNICGQLAATVLFPVLSASARSGTDVLASHVRRARRVILPAGVVAILGVVLGSPILFGYVYDQRYQTGAWMAQGLALGAWFAILRASIDRANLALGDSRTLAVSNVVRLIAVTVVSLGGFYIMGLAGFMVGLAAGTLAAYIVSQAALYKHGVRLMDQDLEYTGMLVGIGGVGAAVPYLLPFKHLLSLIGVAVVCLVPTGIWAARRVFREVFKK